MKMDDFDIIDVFRFAIARVPHIADYLSGRHYAALLQIFAVREILAQVGVIIISLSVRGIQELWIFQAASRARYAGPSRHSRHLH